MFEMSQERSLDWLADAHAEAEARRAQLDERGKRAFRDKLARILARAACQPPKILRRGHSLTDARRAELAGGLGTAARTKLFGEVVDEYFARAYSADEAAPDDLIHVTCTGYLSPSAAQKTVAKLGWGSATRVTHAYQMGCYASLPAVRIGAGFAALGARRVDIVHTELCSLHVDVADHRIEQLVVQSLFADGLIRYSLSNEGPGLELVTAYERILPDSAASMSWIVGDQGMQMSLARDVPDRIGRVLRTFVLELYRRAGLDLSAMKRSVFAVHPGGPKIIDGVRDVLELTEAQVEASRLVLRDHGNMSSATLPHIWMALLADPRVPVGTLIPSLAFGPGLTVCGALFEKR
ncbi:MAG: naringenin-chalcone synthase [Kofleriaceae bacterium]|nr:naringenin-chalcone synthase [Kofleriaceae bacterium]